MIEVKPSDFSNDEIYTSMERVVSVRSQCEPRLINMNKDFANVQRVLKDLKLFHSYMLFDIDYAAVFSWNNDDKILELVLHGSSTPILEAPLDLRIEAHKDLPRLIDLISDRIEEVGAKK